MEKPESCTHGYKWVGSEDSGWSLVRDWSVLFAELRSQRSKAMPSMIRMDCDAATQQYIIHAANVMTEVIAYAEKMKAQLDAVNKALEVADIVICDEFIVPHSDQSLCRECHGQWERGKPEIHKGLCLIGAYQAALATVYAVGAQEEVHVPIKEDQDQNAVQLPPGFGHRLTALNDTYIPASNHAIRSEGDAST